MAIDLTTSALVKVRRDMDASDSSIDSLITSVIARVSRAAEEFMDRETESTSRTVYPDVRQVGQRQFWLRGFPVGSVTSVHYDLERSFGTETLIDSGEYWTEEGTGLLEMDYGLEGRGRGVLRVIYTGGMAANTTAFVAAFPDIADAVTAQVCFLLDRRGKLGQSGESVASGNVTLFHQGDWLPDVKAILMAHRREVYSV